LSQNNLIKSQPYQHRTLLFKSSKSRKCTGEVNKKFRRSRQISAEMKNGYNKMEKATTKILYSREYVF
jgi:hypothetical protein